MPHFSTLDCLNKYSVFIYMNFHMNLPTKKRKNPRQRSGYFIQKFEMCQIATPIG